MKTTFLLAHSYNTHKSNLYCAMCIFIITITIVITIFIIMTGTPVSFVQFHREPPSVRPQVFPEFQMVPSNALRQVQLIKSFSDEFRILSGRTQKLKVAKRCWKQ